MKLNAALWAAAAGGGLWAGGLVGMIFFVLVALACTGAGYNKALETKGTTYRELR